MPNAAPRCAALVLAAALCLAASPLPLQVGTSGDYPPFSVVGADGVRAGFDVAVAAELAKSLGRPLAFLPFRWPELAEKAGSGSFDFVASGVTIRPERVLLGRFTRPYAVAEAVVLVSRDKAGLFADVAALEKAKARIVVNRGGYLESVARATFRQAVVATTDDNRKLDAEVVAGSADALVTDSIEARHLAPLVRIATLTRDRKAVFVPAQIPEGGDSRALHASFDAWMAAHNRELEGLRRTWLDESPLDLAQARVEAIAALVDQRNGVAPWIAAAKRIAGLPIEDLEREKKVLAAAGERARAAGLKEESVVALFAVLIETSKDIQRAAPPIESPITLDTLRGILGDLDERLVAEIAADRPLDAASRDRLRQGIGQMPWPGVGAGRKTALAAALTADF